jgi:alpha-beta hydrolase superfamily lysophospholipase
VPERSAADATSPATRAPTTVAPTSIGPPWTVRQTTLDLYDPTRSSPARGSSAAHSGRALRTTLRWPVSSSGTVAAGRLPFVVFAHGYNVSAATYSVLLDDLTRAGMIVAAPEFPGESTAYPGPAVESDLVNEPCDMEFVAASLEHHPPAALRDALPNAPLIMAGHSDGATAAAWAGYASPCSAVPIRAVVALSPDDVPMTGAFRFGKPPALLAMTGTADEINPLGHTLALYGHVPRPAWLVTIDGGPHLGTFTTDPDLARTDAMIADFVFMVANHDTGARARLTHIAGGRIQLRSR